MKRPSFDSAALEKTVAEILLDVKENGDLAVKKYNEKFDGAALENPLVSGAEIDAAENNIEKFHRAQVEEIQYIETMPGVKCWRQSVAIQKVGPYIPGGLAPLFSTILMLGIPPKIAGCGEIILCTPPNKLGKLMKRFYIRQS